MVSQVASLELAPPKGTHERGVVILEQAMQAADGVAEQPVRSTFVADLERLPEGWRVTDFVAQS